MTRYDPATTALVLIDLQKGIAGAMRAPYSADAVVAKAKTLAAQFRAAGAPVCLVHVAWNTAYSDAPKGLSDAAMALPEGGLPDNWSEFVEGLAQPSDIIVQKRNWGAFYGTDLDLQLRRRGIRTIVLAGIATNFGVESTARDAWERNYNVVIVEDVCTTNSAELHRLAIEFIFPRISRVVQSDQITLT